MKNALILFIFVTIASSILPLARASDLSSTFVAPQAQSFPKEVLNKFNKHEIWLSVVFSLNKSPIADVPSFLQTKVSKKWRIERNGPTPNKLKELTELSLFIDPLEGKINWHAGTLDLTVPVSAEAVYLEAIFEKNQKFEFKCLSEDRIQMSVQSDSGTTQIIFIPQRNLPPAQTIWANREVNIWTAPLGQAKMPTELFSHLKRDDVAYLHHDLHKTKKVFLDVSFPPEFRPVVERIIAKWNLALGTNFFSLEPGTSPIDLGDCLSSNKLCISWQGSRKIPWSGVGGSTASTFDPQNGIILGGMITFFNSADEKLLTPSSDENNKIITSRSLNFDWVVSCYLQKAAFTKYFSPIPDLVVESILLHEVGHFNGFSHNFEGSLAGTPNHPSDSIMEYLPFPVLGHFVDLGDFDLQMIALVYQGILPKKNYTYGGDLDSIISSPHHLANSNNFDLGNPVEWYIALANKSTNGVLEREPGSGVDLLDFLSTFTDHNGGASEEQIEMTNSFLCHQAVDVANTVQKRSGKKLKCSDQSEK